MVFPVLNVVKLAMALLYQLPVVRRKYAAGPVAHMCPEECRVLWKEKNINNKDKKNM